MVVATTDPFEKVAGRGIAMLRAAGIDVVTGVLEKESRELNRRFFTAHTLRRPFITLKWAQSADGFMDWKRGAGRRGACRFSNALTGLSTMRLRSLHDAVLTTGATSEADNCRLTVRDWDGRQPKAVLLDRSRRVKADAPLFSPDNREVIVIDDVDFDKLVDDGLWDVARVETAPFMLGDDGAGKAPLLPSVLCSKRETWGGNIMEWFTPVQ